MARTRTAAVLPLPDLLAQVGNIHTFLGPAGAVPHVDGAVVEALLSCCDADRDPHQVGVGELLARALVPVVPEDLGARGVECRTGLLADLPGALQHRALCP